MYDDFDELTDEEAIALIGGIVIVLVFLIGYFAISAIFAGDLSRELKAEAKRIPRRIEIAQQHIDARMVEVGEFFSDSAASAPYSAYALREGWTDLPWYGVHELANTTMMSYRLEQFVDTDSQFYAPQIESLLDSIEVSLEVAR